MYLLKLVSLFTFFFLYTLNANAQLVKIYKTFEDYQKGIGEEYDDYKGFYHIFGSTTLKLIKDDEIHQVACKDIWGFKYEFSTFRIDKKYSSPAKVVTIGNLIYYENGIGHLEMIRDGSNFSEVTIGYLAYFSKDINSEMVALPHSLVSKTHKIWKNFKKENPEHSILYKCINKNYSIIHVRKCTTEYFNSYSKNKPFKFNSKFK